MTGFAVITDFPPVTDNRFLQFLQNNLNNRACHNIFTSMHKAYCTPVRISENDILIFKTPMTCRFLQKAGKSILQKSLLSLDCSLKYHGIKHVYVAPALRTGDIIEAALADLGYIIYNGVKISDYFIPQAISKKISPLMNNHIGVYSEQLDKRCIEICIQLARQTKYMTIFTGKLLYGSELADNIYRETGLSVNITDKLSFHACSLLLLLDRLQTLPHIPSRCSIILADRLSLREKPPITFMLPRSLHHALDFSDSIAYPDFAEFLLSASALDTSAKNIKKAYSNIGFKMVINF